MAALLSAILLWVLPVTSISETPDSTLTEDSVRSVIREMINTNAQIIKDTTPTRFDSAIVLMERALALANNTLGPNDTAVARCLEWLAYDYWQSGSRSKGIDLYRQAIEAWRNSVGPDYPRIALSLRALGRNARTMGNDTEAESAYKECISFFDRFPPTDSSSAQILIGALGGLAGLKTDTDEFEIAESLYIRAHDLSVEVFGPQSRQVDQLSIRLARLYHYMGDLAKEEAACREAIAGAKRLYGPKSMGYAKTLNSVAWYRYRTDPLDKIEALQDEAMQIWLANQGDDDPHLSTSQITSLQALLEMSRSNYPEAIRWARTAARAREVEYSNYNPWVISDLLALARILVVADSIDSVLEVYDDVLQKKMQYLSTVFRYTSERQKMGFARFSNPVVSELLTLALRADIPRAVQPAYEMIVSSKSVIVDAIAAEREEAFCAEDSLFAGVMAEYSSVCTRLSNVLVDNQMPDGGPLQEDAVDQLFERRDDLERELSRLCALYADEMASRSSKTEDILKALPDSLLLVEYAYFRPYDFDKYRQHGNPIGPPVYLAFSLSKADGLKITDIGRADSINARVRHLKELLAKAPTEYYSGNEKLSFDSIQAIGKALYYELLAPVLEKHSSCSQLVIAPDNYLNLLPFSILSDSAGEFLVEKLATSMVTSSRDILKWKSDPQSVSPRIAALFVDPDYDNGSAEDAQPQLPSFPSGTNSLLTRGSFDCFGADWPQLPQTSIEGQTVSGLLTSNGFESVDAFEKARASEYNLKRLPYSPTILHIASHGFFCEPDQEKLQSTNPLLFSGLVLSGANERLNGVKSDDQLTEDGILTALEFSNLNLSQTELVVLSACETGLGSVQSGEGVYGLRRSILLAGADASLMSMFELPDLAAREMMTDFYANWLSGMSRAKALRQAALTRIEAERVAGRTGHPLLWGGFTLVGDPN